ncbi:MAG: 4a-hydroxytetrahydrobiopterin dehydratase [Candidatus Kapaibacterium sp.]
MSSPDKLSDDRINEELRKHPRWELDGDKIVREIPASNFAAAVGVVNAVAVIAETEQHHPDIFIHDWNKVQISLTSHEAGGLTDGDFKMAAKIDELNF